MSAQDRTEKVLRDIHVLFSKAEPYENSKRDVIVNKTEMMDLLKELNACMYDMMDEHELSQIRKDKAKRELKREGDDIVFEAQRKAEDIYAASIMYTDNALNEIQDIIDKANEDILKIHETARTSMEEQKRTLRSNQSELKSQLNDLIDTQKYLHLIEEENRRLRLEKESKSSEPVIGERDYSAVVPEIRVNTEYFAAQGMLDPEIAGAAMMANANVDGETANDLLEDDPFAEAIKENAPIDLSGASWEFEEEEEAEEENKDEGKGLFSFLRK